MLAALSIAIEFEAEKALNLLVPLLSDDVCLMEIPTLIQVSKEKDDLKFAVLNAKKRKFIGHIVFNGGPPVFERRFHKASITVKKLSSIRTGLNKFEVFGVQPKSACIFFRYFHFWQKCCHFC